MLIYKFFTENKQNIKYINTMWLSPLRNSSVGFALWEKVPSKLETQLYVHCKNYIITTKQMSTFKPNFCISHIYAQYWPNSKWISIKHQKGSENEW